MSKGGGLFLVLRPFYGEKSALDEADGGIPTILPVKCRMGSCFHRMMMGSGVARSQKCHLKNIK